MKNDNTQTEELIRHKVAGLPLIYDVIERMNLRRMLHDAIGVHGNETFAAVDTLILLIINLTLGKQPLYELEQWVQSLDPRCLGYKSLPKGMINDDRFGRALDKLYEADRATLMTRLVIEVVNTFDIKLDRIHNDSTTVKAYGEYPGKTDTGFLSINVEKPRTKSGGDLNLEARQRRNTSLCLPVRTSPRTEATASTGSTLRRKPKGTVKFAGSVSARPKNC